MAVSDELRRELLVHQRNEITGLNDLSLSPACTLAAAVLIIAFFNYYISVAKDLPFRRRFLEMAGLSLAVAGLSFVIAVLIRTLFGVDV